MIILSSGSAVYHAIIGLHRWIPGDIHPVFFTHTMYFEIQPFLDNPMMSHPGRTSVAPPQPFLTMFVNVLTDPIASSDISYSAMNELSIFLAFLRDLSAFLAYRCLKEYSSPQENPYNVRHIHNVLIIHIYFALQAVDNV